MENWEFPLAWAAKAPRAALEFSCFGVLWATCGEGPRVNFPSQGRRGGPCREGSGGWVAAPRHVTPHHPPPYKPAFTQVSQTLVRT